MRTAAAPLHNARALGYSSIAALPLATAPRPWVGSLAKRATVRILAGGERAPWPTRVVKQPAQLPPIASRSPGGLSASSGIVGLRPGKGSHFRAELGRMSLAEAQSAKLCLFGLPCEAYAIECRIDSRPVEVLRDCRLAPKGSVILHPAQTTELMACFDHNVLIHHQAGHGMGETGRHHPTRAAKHWAQISTSVTGGRLGFAPRTQHF